MIGQVIGLTTFHAVWLALESLFASKTQARLGQLLFQLATLKKGGDSIIDYFRKTKLLADTMAVVGQPLSALEFNSYLLAGLGTEFDSLVTSVTTQFDPPTSEELFSHLLTHEARLNHQQTNSLSTIDISANVLAKTSRNNFCGGCFGRTRGSFRGGRNRGGRGRTGSSPFFTDDRP